MRQSEQQHTSEVGHDDDAVSLASASRAHDAAMEALDEELQREIDRMRHQLALQVRRRMQEVQHNMINCPVILAHHTHCKSISHHIHAIPLFLPMAVQPLSGNLILAY
jgi:hypothetical protein